MIGNYPGEQGNRAIFCFFPKDQIGAIAVAQNKRGAFADVDCLYSIRGY